MISVIPCGAMIIAVEYFNTLGIIISFTTRLLKSEVLITLNIVGFNKLIIINI
jgi:hypothetical protein